MLQSIRDRAQSWVMWVIVILLIIPFALWGINSYFGPDATIVVASVNGKELELREFQNTYQRQRTRMRAVLGDSFDLDSLDEQRLKEETLERMIDDELIVQAGIDAGLRIGDEQLAAAIRAQPVFQEDGKFSELRYEAWLRNSGYVPGSFENVLRRDMLRAQLRAGIAGSAAVLPTQVDKLLRLRDQKRSFSTLTVAAERFAPEADLSDARVQAYYDEHREAFTTPEQVRIEYIELSRDRIAESAEPSEEELDRYFETHKDNYVTPEQRRASHILLTVADPEAAEDTLAKARSLLERIRAGESFADLAEEFSEDTGSSSQGGDLGFFGRGAMVKPFEDVVFAMSEGDVSEPVRSEFGFHIIKLTGVNEGGRKGFDAVKEEVRREVRLNLAEERFYNQAEQFANLVFENPDTLEVASESLGLKIQEAGPFPASGGTGIAAERKVIAAAFSEDVIEGNNSEPLELSANSIVALRLRERISAELRPLAEVRKEIEERLRQEHGEAAARELGQAIVMELRNGEDPEAVEAEQDLEWEHFDDVAREAPDLDRALLTEVFRMGDPSDGALFGGISLASGDYAVIAVHSMVNGDPAAADPQDKTLLSRQLVRGMGDEAYQAFTAALRADADVVTFKDRL